MKKKKQNKKYYAGGKINSIENPAKAITESQIAGAKADYEAATDPLSNILNVVGQAGIQAGGMIGGPGAGLAQQFLPAVETGAQFFMAGGSVGGPGQPKPNEDIRNLTPEEVAELQNNLQGLSGDFINEIFGVEVPGQQEEVPLPNLGKYGKAGYFDVVNNTAEGFQLKPTKKNPHNNDSIQDLYKKIRALNPDRELTFMSGGTVPGVPVEVEGKEVAETPIGDLLQFNGPNHEQGGIDVKLPQGTEVYSKRIKVDGVSMADRKKKRKKSEMTLESLMEANSTDNILKNSLSRTKSNNSIEEQKDTQMQEFIGGLLENLENEKAYGGKVKKYMAGGTIFDSLFGGGLPNLQGVGFNPNANAFGSQLPDNFLSLAGDPSSKIAGVNTGVPNIEPTNTFITGDSGISSDPSKSIFANKLSQLLGKGKDVVGGLGKEGGVGIKGGDILSLVGNLYSPLKQKELTLENRAGDTPNINFFENFGKEALLTNEESQGFADEIRDNKIQDLELARVGNTQRNRNSARGVNTLRALDIASANQFNKESRAVNNEFSNTILGLLQQKAGLQNTQDQVVAQGETNRDLADRQDRDNFFSQLATNESDIGAGIQQTGKELNDIAERDVIKNLLDQLSKHGLSFDKNFNLQNPK